MNWWRVSAWGRELGAIGTTGYVSCVVQAQDEVDAERFAYNHIEHLSRVQVTQLPGPTECPCNRCKLERKS